MNKELTPLEALKDLREIRGWNDKEFNERLDIIENALKRKQDLEQMLHKMNIKHGYAEYLKINKALEIIKVLFKGRAKLYTRDDGIEKTIDKNGNYKKAPIGLYILEFWVGDNHYEFHLHREEYDLLKEVLV